MMAQQENRTTQAAYVRHRVEHVDTDASGVMHFSRYASLIETAALEKLEACGAGLLAFQALGLDLLVHELRIKYLSPARFRDRLLLAGTIEHVGPVRIRLAVNVLQEREHEDDAVEPALLATGLLELAVVDQESVQPVPIPEKLGMLLAREK